MFMLLMDVLAWLMVAGRVLLAVMFISAGLGEVVGRFIASLFRRKKRRARDNA